jgi:hypothetical protein
MRNLTFCVVLAGLSAGAAVLSAQAPAEDAPSVKNLPPVVVKTMPQAGDTKVDAIDRSAVVGVWTGSGYSIPTDINLDGITNAGDRSEVVGAWTGSDNCAP